MYSSGLPEKAGLDTIAVRRGKDPRATNSTSSTSAPCSDMLCRHQHLARPAGRGCTPPAASKGFGSQPAGKQKQQAGGAKQVGARAQGGRRAAACQTTLAAGCDTCCLHPQAAEQALADAARSRPRVRPINPREAARGKVDYVQVCAPASALLRLPMRCCVDERSSRTCMCSRRGTPAPCSAQRHATCWLRKPTHRSCPACTCTCARAQVKDWADGKAADIGELQVADGGARGTVFSAAAGDSSSGPLYEQLARHAQHLEVRGAAPGVHRSTADCSSCEQRCALQQL